jgi:hypothetical protein
MAAADRVSRIRAADERLSGMLETKTATQETHADGAPDGETDTEHQGLRYAVPERAKERPPCCGQHGPERSVVMLLLPSSGGNTT